MHLPALVFPLGSPVFSHFPKATVTPVNPSCEHACVCMAQCPVMAWHHIQDVIQHHAQYPWDRLKIHHKSDQETEAATEDLHNELEIQFS